jgi:hypothetical protein
MPSLGAAQERRKKKKVAPIGNECRVQLEADTRDPFSTRSFHDPR